MAKKKPWLRLHTEVMDDPKLAGFTGDEFRVWVYLLCMARESSAPGTIGATSSGIAWRTRLPAEVVECAIAKCEAVGIVRRDEHTVSIARWAERQYEKPSATPEESRKRKAKSRDKESSHADVTRESRPLSVQIQKQSQRTDTETETETAAAVVAKDATPAAESQSVLVNTPPEWPPELDPIRKHLDALQAPGEFQDPAYWREIDTWLGKHPSIGFLDELAKYLNYERGKNRRRQHKNKRAGFSNWLRTAERMADREAQKRAQWQQRGR